MSKKKFKKKTHIDGICISGVADIFSDTHYPVYAREASDYILECHAEIDRLERNLQVVQTEVSNLMSVISTQKSTERVWVSSETHETFPVSGLWLYKGRLSEGYDCYFKSLGDRPMRNGDYTLILAEKDFPVPPKPEPPLEVKVGKYDVPNRGTAEVLSIVGEKCWYVNGTGWESIETVSGVYTWLRDNNARFIGGGDDAKAC